MGIEKLIGMMLRLTAVSAVVMLIMAACGVGESESDSMVTAAPATTVTPRTTEAGQSSGNERGSRYPAAAMSAPALEAWESEAMAFFDRFYEGWPDLEDRFAEFADDAVFLDPSFGDYWIGQREIEAGWALMPGAFPDLDAPVKSVFLSADGAVFDIDWTGFWLGEKPDDVPWPAGLEVFRFDGDLVTSQYLWYAEETLEGVPHHCGGCSADVRAAADRYLTAWSSGDPDVIATIYGDDATLRDSMFGIEVVGAEGIGQSVTERFGAGASSASIESVYGVTIEPSLLPRDDLTRGGDVIAVGVRYRWTPDPNDTDTEVDSLALFQFGRFEAGRFVVDQDNLIATDEVFHEPDSLVKVVIQP